MKAKVINFMGQRKLAAVLSIFLLAASIGSLALNGLKLGLDFTAHSYPILATAVRWWYFLAPTPIF